VSGGKKELLSTTLAERTNKPPSKSAKVWPRRLKVYRILEGLLVQAVRQVYIGARHVRGVHTIGDTEERSALVHTCFLKDALSLPARRVEHVAIFPVAIPDSS
jgi:hypothetical protein